MARNFDITSANAKLTLYNTIFFPAGIKVENFSVDSAWAQDVTEYLEARKGVDGKISFGWIENSVPISITLQPNSTTVDRFNYIIMSMQTAKTPIILQMTIELPSQSKVIYLQNGGLVSGKLLPDGARVLEPMTYSFTFESSYAAPL